MARSQAANLSGMLTSIGDTLGSMGDVGNQYVDTFRRQMAPEADMNDSASLLRYADWARRNGYDDEAKQYMVLGASQQKLEGEKAYKDQLATGTEKLRGLYGQLATVKATPNADPNAIAGIEAQINSIEADPFNKGGLYIAATMYRMGDYTPYLYHTKDYGKTWTLITNGIPSEHFTRVIRADQHVEGLLYCGTEFGMYISSDNGTNWKPFQLNLPPVPITDLALKDNDLIVATQGRSFWIFDDLNVIWDEIKSPTKEDELRLFSTHPTVGYGGSSRTSLRAGTNHPEGVRFYFNVPDGEEKLTLKFLDSEGYLIRVFTTNAGDKDNQFDAETGMNTFDWDTRYEKADKFEGMLLWWGTLQGPKAPPGNYTARLISESDSVDVSFQILLDPRTEGTAEDRQAQFAFLLQIRNKLDETHDAIRAMRDLKAQISALKSRIDNDQFEAVIEEGKRLDSLMTDIEKVLYQTKLKSNQDMLNFPIMLNNKLAHVASLASMGIYRPTEQMIGVAKDITEKIDAELAKWYSIQQNDIPKYNELIRTEKVDVIGVKND